MSFNLNKLLAAQAEESDFTEETDPRDKISVSDLTKGLQLVSALESLPYSANNVQEAIHIGKTLKLDKQAMSHPSDATERESSEPDHQLADNEHQSDADQSDDPDVVLLEEDPSPSGSEDGDPQDADSGEGGSEPPNLPDDQCFLFPTMDAVRFEMLLFIRNLTERGIDTDDYSEIFSNLVGWIAEVYTTDKPAEIPLNLIDELITCMGDKPHLIGFLIETSLTGRLRATRICKPAEVVTTKKRVVIEELDLIPKIYSFNQENLGNTDVLCTEVILPDGFKQGFDDAYAEYLGSMNQAQLANDSVNQEELDDIEKRFDALKTSGSNKVEVESNRQEGSVVNPNKKLPETTASISAGSPSGPVCVPSESDSSTITSLTSASLVPISSNKDDNNLDFLSDVPTLSKPKLKQVSITSAPDPIPRNINKTPKTQVSKGEEQRLLASVKSEIGVMIDQFMSELDQRMSSFNESSKAILSQMEELKRTVVVESQHAKANCAMCKEYLDLSEIMAGETKDIINSALGTVEAHCKSTVEYIDEGVNTAKATVASLLTQVTDVASDFYSGRSEQSKFTGSGDAHKGPIKKPTLEASNKLPKAIDSIIVAAPKPTAPRTSLMSRIAGRSLPSSPMAKGIIESSVPPKSVPVKPSSNLVKEKTTSARSSGVTFSDQDDEPDSMTTIDLGRGQTGLLPTKDLAKYQRLIKRGLNSRMAYKTVLDGPKLGRPEEIEDMNRPLKKKKDKQEQEVISEKK